jgi:hypothetical protein
VTELPELKCVICCQPAAGVFASAFGPISHAYCVDCGRADREEWNTLIGGLMGLRRADVSDWAKPCIAATCAFYCKTEDELWAEVDAATRDYEAAMDSSERDDAFARHGPVFKRHGVAVIALDATTKAEAIEVMASALYQLEGSAGPEEECVGCGGSGVGFMADGSSRPCHCKV